MAVNLIERTIILQPPAGLMIPEDTIAHDPLIIQLAGLAAGKIMFMESRLEWILQSDGVTYVLVSSVLVSFGLSATNDAIAVAGIPSIPSRLIGWTARTFSRNVVGGV
jgi:hypothetical protein